jgi:hypothetical protein
MRHRLSRMLLSQVLGTTKWEKLVFILPFVVLIVDADIFYYSIVNKEPSIIISSGFVLALSVIEIIAAAGEIRDHFSYVRKYSLLERKIADVIRHFESEPTVSQVMEKFFSENPNEKLSRYELYPVVCNILNDEFPNRKR